MPFKEPEIHKCFQKRNLMVDDSTLKHFQGWRLNKRIKSTVSVRPFPEVLTNGMAHHVKGCLEGISPDTVILNHGTNNLKSGNTSEKIATDKVNLKTKFFISGLTVRNDKR